MTTFPVNVDGVTYDSAHQVREAIARLEQVIDNPYAYLASEVVAAPRGVETLRRALGHDPLPGVFDLRRQLGRAPTVAEWRASRGLDR